MNSNNNWNSNSGIAQNEKQKLQAQEGAVHKNSPSASAGAAAPKDSPSASTGAAKSTPSASAAAAHAVACISNLEAELMHQLQQIQVSSCLIYSHGELRFHYERESGASQTLKPINSCTKSIVSSLYCIGLERGMLPAPEQEIAPFFPEVTADQYEHKGGITVEHLLTLTAGFTWQEFGGSNHFPRMSRSENWIKFVLDEPLAHPPGEKWCYNSGISQLLASLIERASGQSLAKLAEQYLFHPLNIAEYRWKRSPQGEYTGGFGMELTAADMLKFGRLFLQEGKWREQQIISSELCRRSTAPYVEVEHPERGEYGWHWWCEPEEQYPYYYARGYGGQFIVVVPDAQMVVVFTRNQKFKGNSPLNIFRNMIHPALTSQYD